MQYYISNKRTLEFHIHKLDRIRYKVLVYIFVEFEESILETKINTKFNTQN